MLSYKQGIKSGDFKIWNSGELTLSGAFENDLQSGAWKWFRSGKKLDSLITFSKGLRNGLYEVYHQNGEQAIAGKYINANREGRWEWWAEDASIDSIKTFSALLILKISGIQLPAIIRGSIHSIHKTFFVLVEFNFFLITLISLLIISITFEASLGALSFFPTNKISLITSLK